MSGSSSGILSEGERLLSEAESFAGSAYDLGTGDIFNFGGGSSSAGDSGTLLGNMMGDVSGGISGGISGGLSFLEQGFAQIFVNLILLIVGIILMVKAFSNTSVGKTVIETTKSGAKSVALAAVA
jgi:hypothetical protein